MKKLMIGGTLVALVAAGCVSARYERPVDAPVAEVAAIDKMKGDDLTTKCAFEKDGYALPYRLHAPAKCAEGVVTPEFSRRMDKAFTDAGIVHGYTEYPGVGHNSWTQTYASDVNLDWMFSKTR